MPADAEIIARLNELLKNKLTTINQYFLHARMLKHAGEMARADEEYKASLDAMKHADMLVEHILKLGGQPRLQELDKLMIGESSDDMLENDLGLAQAALARLEAAVDICTARKDAATAGLLSRILESQRRHIDAVRAKITHATPKLKECV